MVYRTVFGGEFNGPVHRLASVPSAPGQASMAEGDRNLLMHVELPILGGHVLMSTDAPKSSGFKVVMDNNVQSSNPTRGLKPTGCSRRSPRASVRRFHRPSTAAMKV